MVITIIFVTNVYQIVKLLVIPVAWFQNLYQKDIKMAPITNSTTFFQNGNAAQFDYMLSLYPQVLKLKADNRGASKKAEKLIRLDEWYQNTLPKLIQKRGKDAHLLHEELVQTMEWKQARGKFYPQLTHLIKINTPRAVMMETKKAFRKLPNLEQALNALSNLKGVGITMASALLAAALPETAPFMADECLMALPDFESIDYTAKEYLKFVTHIQTTMDRLNTEVHGPDAAESNGETQPKKWTAHTVELAMWSYAVASDLQPELLKDLPESNGLVTTTNGTDHDENSQSGAPSEDSNLDSESASKDAIISINGNADSLDGSENGCSNQDDAMATDANEDTNGDVIGKSFPTDSLDDCTKSGDSLDGPPPTAVEATAAAVATLCTADAEGAVDSDSQSSNSQQKRPLYCDENSEDQPELSAPKLIKL
ncbi:uncharacterized protein LOC131676944 isoform X2 [Topomyia yanbarensis]|uniref:uncharacterized protein LOC131676944 isoform X2 n=1 Tax=Topomyia yanbarensis TaxID=2498891 RepID=UPI00273C67E6|nr:uncharacterized protein LOC131676944 isoform X2 [Topomyia yanbarensis]